MTTKNYLCVLRSDSGQCDEPSPAQMEEMFAKFQAWREKFDDNIVDLGGRLGDGKVIRSTGVSDGPFVEVKEIVGGFMIISGDTIDEAIEVVQACPPVAASDASVEVREIHTP